MVRYRKKRGPERIKNNLKAENFRGIFELDPDPDAPTETGPVGSGSTTLAITSHNWICQ